MAPRGLAVGIRRCFSPSSGIMSNNWLLFCSNSGRPQGERSGNPAGLVDLMLQLRAKRRPWKSEARVSLSVHCGRLWFFERQGADGGRLMRDRFTLEESCNCYEPCGTALAVCKPFEYSTLAGIKGHCYCMVVWKDVRKFRNISS